jgi:murein DD-endopeptidase MepM/ murein hydrolase activator NlpD
LAGPSLEAAPGASARVVAPEPALVGDAASAVEAASTTGSAAAGTAGGIGVPVRRPPPAAEPPCPARDPEDGACYASADAADRAWLARPLSDDEEDEGEESALSESIWTGLADRLKGLVVRRSDSRPVSLPESEIRKLFGVEFPIPLASFDQSRLHDTFLSRRGRTKKHHAIDLGAPRGTPVLAVCDGVIERLGRDRRGGKVIYLRDLSGHYTFFYAHLSSHEKGLKAGDRVKKGQRLGAVGSTGRVIGGPHLHFAIFRLEPATDSRRFAVNPYLIFSIIVPR